MNLCDEISNNYVELRTEEEIRVVSEVLKNAWQNPNIPAQMRNTRATAKITHAGLTLSFAEWAEITGISVNTLRARHYLKWKPPDLFKPARKHH